MLVPAQFTLLAERRNFRPWGLKGGGDGAAGSAWIVNAAGDEGNASRANAADNSARGMPCGSRRRAAAGVRFENRELAADSRYV
jgi:N-methylhydantoinase B/oxoprolinase/acetone carboxylase alpha subunit